MDMPAVKPLTTSRITAKRWITHAFSFKRLPMDAEEDEERERKDTGYEREERELISMVNSCSTFQSRG